MVSNLNIGNQFAFRYNDASTFVATDERELGSQWPVTIDCVKICVADARVFDVDKNLIWAWLLDWDSLVYNSCEM